MTISNNSDGLPTRPRLTYLTDDRLDIVTAKEFHVLKYLEKVWDDSWSFQSFQSYFYKRTNMRIFQHEGFTPIRSE
jgi:hypothetical protein